MSFNINEFYSALQFGGARPNLFDVIITWPGGAFNDIQFLCSATSIPGATLNTIPRHYFGRELKFAGNRTFEDWTVTIVNDEDYEIRDGMEALSNSLNDFEFNVRESGRVQTNTYKGMGTVTHYGKTGDLIRRYELRGLMPTTISPMTVDWQTDEIQTFDVTFSMDYWVIIGNANAAGNLLTRPVPFRN